MNDLERVALRAELMDLKEKGARRQDLSQYACKRLFFDFGIRPSMATVRDLTQTGSASDIPKDIDAFWARIRSVSRIRIEGGAIPDVLQERAGELLGQLFQEARLLATQSLEAERHLAKQDTNAVLSQLHDSEVRFATIAEALQRSETRADVALAHNSALETELFVLKQRNSDAQDDLRALLKRLDGENLALAKRLDTEQTANAELRDRVDALNYELRQNTEHYALQIKDAVSEAERRVKPMLVELDSLRGMAATYQNAVRQANQKEFDFLQQLSSAKARADRFEAQLREKSDEIDDLASERDVLRAQSGISKSAGRLICAMVEEGRLSNDEILAMGTDLDAFVALPSVCPYCGAGEPELAQHGSEFELSCPDCERSSGASASRLMAVASFKAAEMLDTPQPADR